MCIWRGIVIDDNVIRKLVYYRVGIKKYGTCIVVCKKARRIWLYQAKGIVIHDQAGACPGYKKCIA
jgi:hypothetical protein